MPFIVITANGGGRGREFERRMHCVRFSGGGNGKVVVFFACFQLVLVDGVGGRRKRREDADEMGRGEERGISLSYR